MAKVTAPFFSLTAGGTIGDAITFSRWKGVKYVRQYTKPSDPNSLAQQAQRSYLRDAVDTWHVLSLTAEDKISWDRWALYSSAALSGFNKYISEMIAIYQTGKDVAQLYDLHIEDATPGHFNVCVREMNDVATLSGEVRIGTDQGFMPIKTAMTWAGGDTEYQSGDIVYPSGSILYIRVDLSDLNFAGIFGNLRYQVT
jgi:hypothetical protein